MLKLDFENAFNTVDRAKALEQVRAHFPSFARWAHWCYGNHTRLFFANMDIAPATGVQQGDPLGPLLFALCIHPLVLRLHDKLREGAHADSSALSLFYLDDGILCGNADAVGASLRFVMDECARLGLKLNLSKCELIAPAGHVSSDLFALFPRDLLVDENGDNRVVYEGGVEFLGAPLGSHAFCQGHAAARVDQARACYMQ